MDFFAEYIQPLTEWLRANPGWALFFTFLISLTESLAIIGSIIPGSVSMTAIGILAGSGVMRIDLTLIAATLGAIAGDSLSYFIGYYYSNSLYEKWPFRTYPKLLIYGTQFFQSHGGKSVLIGRFVGPLRSIIPVVAGIVRMQQWRFLLANVVSAIGWSVLYVFPGILIGAASHELSPEVATRLFIIILVGLALVWLLGIVIKWVLLHINNYTKQLVSTFWGGLANRKGFRSIYAAFTPREELEHFDTGMLVLTALFAALMVVSILACATSSELGRLNYAINYFFQTLQTIHLRHVFTIISQFISYWSSAMLITGYAVICLYTKAYKALFYFLALVSSAMVTYLGLDVFITSLSPLYSDHFQNGAVTAFNQLILTTTLYLYLSLHKGELNASFIYVCRSLLLALLLLSGISTLYLGYLWVSDVVTAWFIGIFIALLVFLLYRAKIHSNTEITLTNTTIGVLLSIIILTPSLLYVAKFRKQVYLPELFSEELLIEDEQWWDQKNPVIPLYRYNRLGSPANLMNIQYQGSLKHLQNSLKDYGWVQQSDTFFRKLLQKVDPEKNTIKLPLFTQLYNNKPPKLLMTYRLKQKGYVIALRVWESDYNLTDFENPLWVGSIEITAMNGKPLSMPASYYPDPMTYLLPALDDFCLRRLQLTEKRIKKTALPVLPYILLIREKSN